MRTVLGSSSLLCANGIAKLTFCGVPQRWVIAFMLT